MHVQVNMSYSYMFNKYILFAVVVFSVTDECLSNPCRNEGQCFNGLNQYVCKCAEKFTGKSCTRSRYTVQR